MNGCGFRFAHDCARAAALRQLAMREAPLRVRRRPGLTGMERPVRESQIAMRRAMAQASSMDITAATLDHLRSWTGRTEQRDDVVAAAPLAGWIATLDRADDPAPAEGTELAPLAHWLYFLPQALQREIGADGHPRRGGFLPPVALPRRMWAGGRLAFHHALRVGDAVTRRST